MTVQNNTSQALLSQGLTLLDIPDTGLRISALLLQYIHELEMFNARFNLVKVKNTEELIIRHIFDSLSAWKIIAEKIDSYRENYECTIADIGSGAGLPGIPLACLFSLINPSVRFTLIERMKKRCSVLENIQAVLGLTNTRIMHTEVEKAPDDCFDIAVFRAFSPLEPLLLNTIKKKLKSNGIITAYKGRKAVIAEEMQKMEKTIPEYTIKSIKVPFYAAERNIVLVHKE